GLRHHLSDDPGRAGGQHEIGQLLRLPGILRLSARRKRRFLCGDGGAHQRRADRDLHRAAAPPEFYGMRRRDLLPTVLTYAAVVVLVVTTLAPLVWLFIMSISSTPDLTSVPLHWLPHQADFSRYARLLTIAAHSAGEEFIYAMRNSLGASFSATVIALLAG